MQVLSIEMSSSLYVNASLLDEKDDKEAGKLEGRVLTGFMKAGSIQFITFVKEFDLPTTSTILAI